MRSQTKAGLPGSRHGEKLRRGKTVTAPACDFEGSLEAVSNARAMGHTLVGGRGLVVKALDASGCDHF